MTRFFRRQGGGGQRLGGREDESRGPLLRPGSAAESGAYGSLMGALNPSRRADAAAEGALAQIAVLALSQRCIALMDGLQLFFDALAMPLWLALLWGPAVGYLSTTLFQTNLAALYLLYWVVRINGFAYLLFTGPLPVLSFLMVAFSCFVIYQQLRFYRLLKPLSEADRGALRDRPLQEWANDLRDRRMTA